MPSAITQQDFHRFESQAPLSVRDFPKPIERAIVYSFIEAKNYEGTLYSGDDVKNSQWYILRKKTRISISSCWGKNPYQQAKKYTDSLHSRLSESRRNPPIKTYGVVVFPDNTSLSEIGTEIGKYHKVSRLGDLADCIDKLINQSKAEFNQANQRLNVHEIETIMFGRSAKH
jgi:hypothetical protein